MGGGSSKAKRKAEEDSKAKEVEDREKELSKREADLKAKEEDLAAREAALTQSQEQGDPLNQSGLAPLPPRRGAAGGGEEGQASRGSTALPIDDDRESVGSSRQGGGRRGRNRRKSMFFAEEIDVNQLTAPPTAAPEVHHHHTGGGEDAGDVGEAWLPIAGRASGQPVPEGAREERAVRVFVCSSLDGGHEHTVLHKAVYPRLVSDAARRGVTLRIVDLRDSRLSFHENDITDDAGSALLLEQMLHEADRCAPVFVGLIGETYLDGVGDDLVAHLQKLGVGWAHELEGDLGPLREAAATDVIVRRGALVRKGAWGAFLFERVAGQAPFDPSLVRVGRAVQAQEGDLAAWAGEVEGGFRARGALGDFEMSMVRGGLPVVVCDTRAGVVEGVYAEVRAVLDQMFPADGALVSQFTDNVGNRGGWFQSVGRGFCAEACDMRREQGACRAYQAMCCDSCVAPADGLAGALSEHCGGAGPRDGAAGGLLAGGETKPFVVIDSGGGATVSPSLAVWARGLADGMRGKGEVVYHRLGLMAGPCAVGRELMVVLRAVRRAYGLLEELPSEEEAHERLREWLVMAGRARPLVLVLDGLDMLADGMGGMATGLWTWLPELVPAGCRVVVGVDDDKKTGFQTLKLVTKWGAKKKLAAAAAFAGGIVAAGGMPGAAEVASMGPGGAASPPEGSFRSLAPGVAAEIAAGEGGGGADADLEVVDQERFCYVAVGNQPARARAAAWRRLRARVAGQTPPQTAAGVGEGGDWADEAAAKVGPGLMPMVVAAMTMRRHASMFRAKGGGEAVALAGAGSADISTCEVWPEEATDLVLERAFVHLTRVVVKRGLPDTAPGEFLIIVAESYCGVDEYRLSDALKLSALHFSILLREVSPYLMHASGVFFLAHPVRKAVLKHYANRPRPAIASPFLNTPKDLPHMLQQHDEVYVAEALAELLPAKDRRGQLRALVTDTSFFVRALHSSYFPRYRSAWAALAAEEGSVDIAAELRTSAQHYTMVTGSDGALVESQLLARELALCHSLMVTRFLAIQAAQPGQAMKLLNELRPAVAEGGACAHFLVAFWGQYAVVHRENGDQTNAIEVLKDALSKQPEAGLPLQDPERVPQDWRDRAYVAGFLADAHVAGRRLLAELYYSSGGLREAEQLYTGVISTLKDALAESTRVELELGKTEWAAAKLAKENIKQQEAMARGQSAQKRLNKALYPDHPLCKQVDDFVAALDRRQKQEMQAAGGADVDALLQGSDMLKDLGAQDEDNLDSVTAGEAAHIPVLQQEFEAQYSKEHYRMAHKVALKLLLTVEANVDTGTHEEEWCSAAMLLAKVLGKRGLYTQSVKVFEEVIEARLHRAESDGDLKLVLPRIEQSIVLMMQGDYERAYETVRRFEGWHLLENLGDDHPAVIRMQYAQSVMMIAQGAQAEALELLQAVKKKQAGTFAHHHEEVLTVQVQLAELQVRMSMYEEAGKGVEALGSTIEKHLGAQAFAMAEVRYLRGWLMLLAGDYKGSDDFLREAARISSLAMGKPLGEDGKVRVHPMVVVSSAKIAEKSLSQGRFDEARNIYDTVLKSFYATEVKPTSLAFAELQEVYAVLCEHTGRPIESLQRLQEASEMRQLVPGMHADAMVHSNLLLAQQEINMGNYRGARDTVDSTVIILEKAAFCSRLDKCSLSHLQAQLAFLVDVDLDGADAFYKEAISLKQALVGEAHPSVALLQLEHAYILMEKKDFEAVETSLKDANSSITLTFGKATGHLSAVHRLQGLVHRNRGKYEEADYVLQSALLVDGNRDWAAAFIAGDYARPPQPRTVQVVQDLEAMGRVQYRRGHFEAADHMLKHMHSVSLSLYGEDAEHPVTARALVGLSDLRVEYGHYVEAEALCRKGLDMQRRILSAKHPHTLRTMAQYSRILHLCGDFENASAMLKDIKQGLSAILGKDHLQVRLIDARLAMVLYAMGVQKRPRAPLIQCLALIEGKIIKPVAGHAGKAKPAAAKKAPDNPKKGDPRGGVPAADLKISLLDKDRAQIFLWLAECDIDVFKLTRAGQFLRMAEDCYRRMGKTGEPMVGVCKTRHADISFLRGRLAVSLNMYKQAAGIKKRSFWGSDHPELAEDEEGMARVHVARAMYEEAEERYQRALELTDNRMATRNARRGGTLALIAELMQVIGRYDDAEEMLATSRELQIGFTTRSKASVLGVYREGSLCVARGHYQAAKKLMEQVVSQGQLHSSCRDAMRCTALCEVGFAEVGQRRFARANEALRAARAALEGAHAGLPGNRSEADKKAMLQNVVGRASKYTKVTRTFIQTIIPHAWKQQRSYGMYPVRARLALLEAKVDLELGRLDKAEVGLRRLIDVFEAEDKATPGRTSPHPGVAECQSHLAQVKFALGEYPESESLFLAAKDGKWLGGWEGTCTSHAVDAEGLCRLARVFARYDDAADLLRQARDCRMLAAGDEDSTADVVALDILGVGIQVERGQYGMLNDSVETSLADEARKLSLLKQSFLFDKLMDGDKHAKDRVLQQVAGASTVRSFREMEVIAEQGTREPALYIVSSGAVAVCVAAQGGGGGDGEEATDAEVSRLRAGDSVGEFCLLFGESWLASLVAMSSGEALCISHKAVVVALKAADSAPDTVAEAVAAEDRVWKLQGLMKGRGDPPVADAPAVIAERIRKAYKIEKAGASARQQRRRSSVAGGGGGPESGRGRRRGSIAFDGIGGLPSHPGINKESSLPQDVVVEEKPEEAKAPSPAELLALSQKLCGPDTVTTANALLLSGLTACVRFSWTAAVDFFDRAHETMSKAYYGCWHNSPGDITAGYARVLLVLGRREEALELLSLDLTAAERVYGATHANMIPLFAATASAHLDAGDSRQTLEWANRALALAKKFYGAGSPVAASVMSAVARTAAMKGDVTEAVSALEKARSQKLRGGWLEGAASVVDDVQALAESFVVVGRFHEADGELTRVAAARQEFAHKGLNKAAAGITVEGVRMRSLMLQGQLDEGVKIARRMIDAETKGEGEVCDVQHVMVEARRMLGEYGLRTGRSEDAVGNLIKAVTICSARYTEGHPGNVGAVLHYARVRATVDFRDRKGLAEAEEAVIAAKSWLTSSHGDDHPLMCEVNLATAAIHTAYYRRPTALECVENARKQYQQLYESAVGRARKKAGRISLSREGPRSPEMGANPIPEDAEDLDEQGSDWSFMVAVCQLELAKLHSVNGWHAAALEQLTDYYSACDSLFPSSEKDQSMTHTSTALGQSIGGHATNRYFDETPRTVNGQVPGIPLKEYGLSGGRSLLGPPQKALDLRIHVEGAFGWLEKEEEEEDMVSPMAQTGLLGMQANTSISRRSSMGTHRSYGSQMSTVSPLARRRRGPDSKMISPIRGFGRQISAISPLTGRTHVTSKSSVVSRDEFMYAPGEDTSDMDGGGGGEAGKLWTKIVLDTVDWDALNFETPRLVELDALVCQAHLLLRMSRFGDAFSTVLHLEAGLEALKLQRHPYARESEVLKAHCLLGASKYEEAESMFEYLLAPTPEDRIKDPLSGSLLRGAASVKEVLKDLSRAAVLYKQAAAMYAESAGTSDMPEVHECELAALRVRWHAGLLPDAYVGMQRSIESLERLVGKDHPSVSIALIDYADVLVSDREYDTCESLYTKAHAALSERCGDDHPMTARCAASLAMLHHLAGPASRHYKDVMTRMDEAIEVLVQRLGRKHAALCPVLDNYGRVCADRGEHEKAEELRHWSIQVLTATHGPNNHLVDAERERLVASLLAQQKVEEARAMYANILEGREKAKGNDAVELCPLLVLMARLEMGDSQHPVAERLLKRSLAIKQKHHTVTLSKEARLAKDRLRARRNSVQKDTTSLYHVACVPELTGLAEVCCASEEFKDSELYYLSCLTAQKGYVAEVTDAEKKVDAGHTHALAQAKALSTEAKLAVAMTKRAMSSMFALKGDLGEAEQWGRQALADVVSVLGPEHPRCLAIKTSLAGLYRAQAEHVEAQRLYLDTGVM